MLFPNWRKGRGEGSERSRGDRDTGTRRKALGGLVLVTEKAHKDCPLRPGTNLQTLSSQ